MRRRGRDSLERAVRERARVVDPAGAHLGRAEAIYYDGRSGEPSWIGVRDASEPSRRVLVPVAGASRARRELRVAHEQAAVRASPPVQGEAIDEETERALRSHYGIEPPPALVRHEEELVVDRELEELGVLRVRKHVEAGRVEGDVPREVEHAELERVPVDGDDSGLVETLPDGSISIPVFEEQIVVSKRTVVRERVVVRKERTTQAQTVGGEVRRERVEIEADPGVEVQEVRPSDEG